MSSSRLLRAVDMAILADDDEVLVKDYSELK